MLVPAMDKPINTTHASQSKKVFNLKNVPNDFMMDDDIRSRIRDTIDNIQNSENEQIEIDEFTNVLYEIYS